VFMSGTASTLFAGCTEPDSQAEASWVSPLDGQTGWDPAQPLVAFSNTMDIPPDYPLPELVRVVDIDEGGVIPGRVERSSTLITFTPDDPLPENRRFGWVIDVPDPVPHGPSLVVPDRLREPLVVDTSPRIDVLAGSVDDVGLVCVVLSRVLTGEDRGSWRLAVGPVEVGEAVGFLVPRSEWGPDLDLPEGDLGVDVLCFDFAGSGEPNPDPTEPPPVSAGEEIRLWWGDSGPWLITLAEGSIVGEVNRLRRGQP
jgi:hypothetical protein